MTPMRSLVRRSTRRTGGSGKVVICSLAALLLGAFAAAGQAATIGRDLERRMAAHGSHADTAVIIRFAGSIDVEPFAVTDRRTRNNRLMLALKAQTARHRADVEPLLVSLGAERIKDLWIVDGLAVTLPAVAVKQLATRDDIRTIDLDSLVQGGRPQRLPAARARPSGPAALESALHESRTSDAPVGAAEWNIAAVHAPELWALGHTGRRVVVATMDTGADVTHPDLRRSYRGGSHAWFDPHGEEATPYDQLGHGTQALGVIVGRRGAGVSPDARWIASRLYDNNGRASMSDIHRVFQWLMDPDGDPATLDAPDVVNASWTLSGRAAGSCIAEFAQDIRMLKNAGIAVVFAAGNDGPAAGTSSSPGNNPGVLAVGAVDRDLEISRQTSRGPSSCDGSVFPRIVAPGIDVRTTDLSYGGQWSYTTVSGSSLAAPHVAGVVALLAGAFPSASVLEIESAIMRSAHDLGADGQDGGHGRRLVDALAAFKSLRDSLELDHAGDSESNVPRRFEPYPSPSVASSRSLPEPYAASPPTGPK
jgi:bacillopeptidase F